MQKILAIVGSTDLSKEQESAACDLIDDAIRQRQPRAIVSGGANGVDRLAESRAKRHGIPTIVCVPAQQSWACFKERNLLVAEICGELVRISKADSKTYGSGWTADRAEEMGKPVERHVI